VPRIFGSFALAVVLGALCLAPADAQGDRKKNHFQVADSEKSPEVIERSLSRKGRQFDALKDANGDGVYDTVRIPLIGELTAPLDLGEAQGFTYSSLGEDITRRVVFYPCDEVKIPADGEFLLYGMVHYFDDKELSSWYACVVYKVQESDQPAAGGKKLSPYKVDFIDRAGNRVGTPALLLLNTSAIGSNPDFQRWQKQNEEIVLGYNPIAENRELFIFRKLPQLPDKVMMIFFRWF
jgi:hypothetical protein